MKLTTKQLKFPETCTVCTTTQSLHSSQLLPLWPRLKLYHCHQVLPACNPQNKNPISNSNSVQHSFQPDPMWGWKIMKTGIYNLKCLRIKWKGWTYPRDNQLSSQVLNFGLDFTADVKLVAIQGNTLQVGVQVLLTARVRTLWERDTHTHTYRLHAMNESMQLCSALSG